MFIWLFICSPLSHEVNKLNTGFAYFNKGLNNLMKCIEKTWIYVSHFM